jgi:hypothetical protein
MTLYTRGDLQCDGRYCQQLGRYALAELLRCISIISNCQRIQQ